MVVVVVVVVGGPPWVGREVSATRDCSAAVAAGPATVATPEVVSWLLGGISGDSV